jgi:hypothetical protein
MGGDEPGPPAPVASSGGRWVSCLGKGGGAPGHPQNKYFAVREERSKSESMCLQRKDRRERTTENERHLGGDTRG